MVCVLNSVQFTLPVEIYLRLRRYQYLNKRVEHCNFFKDEHTLKKALY